MLLDIRRDSVGAHWAAMNSAPAIETARKRVAAHLDDARAVEAGACEMQLGTLTRSEAVALCRWAAAYAVRAALPDADRSFARHLVWMQYLRQTKRARRRGIGRLATQVNG